MGVVQEQNVSRGELGVQACIRVIRTWLITENDDGRCVVKEVKL